MTRILSVLAVATLVACGTADEQKAVDNVEDKAKAGAPAAPSKDDENNASKVLREAQTLIAQDQPELAKQKLAELNEKFPNTRAARASARVTSELELIGKDAAPLEVEKWFQGSAADLEGSKAQLYVFWEAWCPHCKREVPRMQEIQAQYADKGLKIVGLTKMSRGVTDDDVAKFLSEGSVTYPVAKEVEGKLSSYYAVRGIPAAVVLKDGKVVWRGHPARLDEATIDSFLGES